MFRGSLGLASTTIRPCCKLLPGALPAFTRRTIFSAVGPDPRGCVRVVYGADSAMWRGESAGLAEDVDRAAVLGNL
jgi:hypothetical protein